MKPLAFPALALVVRDGALETAWTHGAIQVTSVSYDKPSSVDHWLPLPQANGYNALAQVSRDIQISNPSQVALLASILPPLDRPVMTTLDQPVRAIVVLKDGIVQNVITDTPIGLIEVDASPVAIAPQDQSQSLFLEASRAPALADWVNPEVNPVEVARLIEAIEVAERSPPPANRRPRPH